MSIPPGGTQGTAFKAMRGVGVSQETCGYDRTWDLVKPDFKEGFAVIESTNNVPISVQYTVTQDENCYVDGYVADKCMTYFDTYGGLGFGTSGTISDPATLQKPTYSVLNLVPSEAGNIEFKVAEGFNPSPINIELSDLYQPFTGSAYSIIESTSIKYYLPFSYSGPKWLLVDGIRMNPANCGSPCDAKAPDVYGKIYYTIGADTTGLGPGTYKARFTLHTYENGPNEVPNSPICFDIILTINPGGGGGGC